jgi:serine protease Do/serine protease DegQ
MAGNPVLSAQEFHNLEGQFPVGEPLELEYVRDQEIRRTEVRVEELKVMDGGSVDARLEGATFEELAFKQRSEGAAGILISSLDPRSRLARQGLREGDIITGFNRVPIRDLAEFREALRGENGTLYLQVRRGGRDYVARID